MKYTIECLSHRYITLRQDGRFIFTLDNNFMNAEEMIYKVMKRTGMKFQDITIKGDMEDFSGLHFYNGSSEREFWNDFPEDREIKEYMKLKEDLKL